MMMIIVKGNRCIIRFLPWWGRHKASVLSKADYMSLWEDMGTCNGHGNR